MKNQSKINGIIRGIILFFGIIAITFTVGCKKKADDGVTPITPTCKVNKIVTMDTSVANGTRIVDVTYDSDFKIISTTTIQGGVTVTTTYTYLPNGRIKLVDSNSPNNYREYVLNSAGNVQTSYLNENGHIITTQYQYDTEGYLVQTTSELDIFTYTYENGNLKRIVWRNPANTYTSTTEYEYTGALVASNGNDVFKNEWFIPTGKNSTNLYTKITSTISWGTAPNVINVSYVLDSNNKITKATLQDNGSEEKVVNLSYICQ